MVSAMSLLSVGADYAAAARSEYTRLLFLLSKGMVCIGFYAISIVLCPLEKYHF